MPVGVKLKHMIKFSNSFTLACYQTAIEGGTIMPLRNFKRESSIVIGALLVALGTYLESCISSKSKFSTFFCECDRDFRHLIEFSTSGKIVSLI